LRNISRIRRKGKMDISAEKKEIEWMEHKKINIKF
jgi:hypothetical protein